MKEFQSMDRIFVRDHIFEGLLNRCYDRIEIGIWGWVSVILDDGSRFACVRDSAGTFTFFIMDKK